jgi:hypothetical protein
MFLNGLWIICDDGSSAAASTPAIELQPEAAADCLEICAMHHQANGGKMCLILPGTAKKSIAVVDFGLAILTPVIQLKFVSTVEWSVTDLSLSYLEPSFSSDTPPPKA